MQPLNVCHCFSIVFKDLWILLSLNTYNPLRGVLSSGGKALCSIWETDFNILNILIISNRNAVYRNVTHVALAYTIGAGGNTSKKGGSIKTEGKWGAKPEIAGIWMANSWYEIFSHLCKDYLLIISIEMCLCMCQNIILWIRKNNKQAKFH